MVEGNIPTPTMNVDDMLAIFEAKSLTLLDLVALSGSFPFKNPFFPFSSLMTLQLSNVKIILNMFIYFCEGCFPPF